MDKVLIVMGLCLFILGLWLMYPPLAIIAASLCLIALGGLVGFFKYEAKTKKQPTDVGDSVNGTIV